MAFAASLRVSTMQLTFSAADGRTLAKGPYQGICLQGETLRERPDAPTVAVHEDHHWVVDGRNFARFDCDCRVNIFLTRVDGKRTRRFGPFDSLSAQDGVLFADHSVFAFADRSIGDWYCHDEGSHWAFVIVEAAD